MENKEICILIVEDNPGDLRLVSEMFRESVTPVFKISSAGRLDEALKMLENDIFDVVLMDLDLPDSRGLSGLEKITSQNQKLPIMVLTGLNDESTGVEAMQKHAADYLIKGQINVNILVRSVRYAIERKKTEEILKRDKETLARLVEERSAELVKIQMELEKSRRLSDIGTLAATVAHELRNPLATISMATANIKKKANNPLLERHLHTIEKKVAESDQIISNLLFYSRLRPPRYENVNIQNILNECIDISFTGFNKKISVKKDFHSIQDISISADPLQLKETFINLLSNAHDAVSEPAGIIEIWAGENNGFIEVYIRDNGCGIEKEHLERIFDPFFTTKTKGTGLGLTVCSQIVNMHGGMIHFESEPDKGTTVMVRLPKRRE